MILWCIFALMTAAAIFAVMWPLGRHAQKTGGGSDIVVYKDQLQEIDRDRSAGLIGEAEAEAARLEVSRRLLAAAETQPPPAASPVATQRSLQRRRAAAVAVLVILPFGAPGLYVALGSPNIAGEPALARADTAPGHESIDKLVGQVEAHLARNRNDGAGWEVLAPVYMRLGRFDDAVEARKKALVLNGDSAAREADLGEAEAAAANGVVTADAKAAFELLPRSRRRAGRQQRGGCRHLARAVSRRAGRRALDRVRARGARARDQHAGGGAGAERQRRRRRGQYEPGAEQRDGRPHGRGSRRPPARERRRPRRLAPPRARLCRARRPR
jgi:cytochrome c-type biogenesis protein CcmI